MFISEVLQVYLLQNKQILFSLTKYGEKILSYSDIYKKKLYYGFMCISKI